MLVQRAVINGLKTTYRVFGEGTPFLILHGWGSNSSRWQKVAELLSKRGLKVIIPDLPGFGESERPTTVWGLSGYVVFIKHFVAFLNLEKFYLLGHSFGGAVSAKFTIENYEKIEKLFLVSAACFRRKSFKKKFFNLLSKILKIFSFVPFYSYFRKGFYKFFIRSDYPYTEGIMKDIYSEIIKEDLSDELTKIRFPTVIIWGAKDNVTKLSEGRLINQKIKSSQLEIIPEQNHDLNLKAPEKLSEAVVKYL